jgi:hypothetical protein
MDIEEVAAEMATLQQRADALAAERPGDPVTGELLTALSDFGQSQPLLRLLAAPQLRDRHWASILATLGLEVLPCRSDNSINRPFSCTARVYCFLYCCHGDAW